MSEQNPNSAQVILEKLVQRHMIELQGNTDPAKLAAGASQVLGSAGGLQERASALAQWLMGQESVAELYATDEELASLLQQG